MKGSFQLLGLLCADGKQGSSHTYLQAKNFKILAESAYIHSRTELTKCLDLSLLRNIIAVLHAPGNSGFAGCSWDDQLCQYVHLDAGIFCRDYCVNIIEFFRISKWIIKFHPPSFHFKEIHFFSGITPQEGRQGK